MRRLRIVLPLVSVLLLTACGGNGQPSKPAPGSPENPVRALPNPAATRVPPIDETGARATSSPKDEPVRSPQSLIAGQKATQARNERRRARRAKAGGERTGAVAAHRQPALAPSAKRPCSLVTRTQARAIVGAAILEPLEAPQGPTCIYKAATGRALIGLTVQKASFATLREQVRRGREIAVAHRRGVCGSYGGPMLYLPVGGGRVLSIAGSCAMASRFAAQAIAHL
jgi:hypothetical protein